VRIIAGTARGRRLRPVRGQQVRPTGDRVREALFSILAQRPVGARVLDLCAGTGALGIEALSRGARRATFIESDPDAAQTIYENLEHCRLLDRGRILVRDVQAFLAAPHAEDTDYGLVFLDPPYASDLAAQALALLAPPLLAATALVVVEHAARNELSAATGSLLLGDRRAYGQTRLSFYRLAASPTSVK
jgi:16S rRNA (guanine(966)-N(2))-methyltransferase RsmD